MIACTEPSALQRVEIILGATPLLDPPIVAYGLALAALISPLALSFYLFSTRPKSLWIAAAPMVLPVVVLVGATLASLNDPGQNDLSRVLPDSVLYAAHAETAAVVVTNFGVATIQWLKRPPTLARRKR